MYNEENYEEMDDKMGHHMSGDCCSKEFKLAMLEKKEKILEAKLEFIGKVKKLINKADSETKEK